MCCLWELLLLQAVGFVMGPWASLNLSKKTTAPPKKNNHKQSLVTLLEKQKRRGGRTAPRFGVAEKVY